ncbi:hypothetical protein [Pinirhizobacter sp.]|uniref:hypothetical protein n=1 Tax=Pinirhizobacter sp. TaxID=2950432 RepID=UPI0039C939C5
MLATIGGNLRVESEQDTDDYASKSVQAGVKVVYGAGVSVSANFDQSKVKSNYAGVNEVSGIKAGQGGFDITVGGNTHLKGGVIASTADASKNILDTGSLTVEHLLNKTEASSNSSGYGFDTSMASSKYGAFKGALANALDGGSADKDRSNETRSDIAAGTVIVRDGNVGALAELDRTATDLANTALAHIDLDKLQEKAEIERGINGLANVAITHVTDEAHRTMFEKEAQLYVIERDAEGNPLPRRLLTLDERNALLSSSDGKVHIANNGIFNDVDGAEKYALQHSSADGPQYFLHFPKADNKLSEILVAGYMDKLEGSFFGYTNATSELIGIMSDYGQQGLHLDGHSRGSMTVGNAMMKLVNSARYGSLSSTTVDLIGPAYNLDTAAQSLIYLRGNLIQPDGSPALTYANHIADVVGRKVGFNSPTGGSVPEGSSKLLQYIRGGLGLDTTAHNCYGNAGPSCVNFWKSETGQQSQAQGVYIK